MCNENANEIMNFGQKFRDRNAEIRSDFVRKNDSKDFCTPVATCRFLADTVDQMEKICSSSCFSSLIRQSNNTVPYAGTN